MFWLWWVFAAAHGLSLVVVGAAATLHCHVRTSHCGGFPCGGARALGMQASVATASGLTSCGTLSMWDLSGPEIEPVSFALQGRFLTIGPTRETCDSDLLR